jgi:hypothetical protein
MYSSIASTSLCTFQTNIQDILQRITPLEFTPNILALSSEICPSSKGTLVVDSNQLIYGQLYFLTCSGEGVGTVINGDSISTNHLTATTIYVENLTGPSGGSGAGATGPTGGVGPTGNVVGIPVGGTINQLLTKQSATDYDTVWTSDIVVNSINNGGEYTGTNMFLDGDLDISGRLASNSSIIRIGLEASIYSPGGNNIAIGYGAATDTQGPSAIAIGNQAGTNLQSSYSISIGRQAGYFEQKSYSIAIGDQAGLDNQDLYSIAIGLQAGQNVQGFNCIAIGNRAGFQGQVANTIAIGYHAGYSYQDFNAIAIGNNAGAGLQHANTIILNASGSVLNSTGTDRLHVRPVRGVASATPVLVYDTANYEITYNTSSIKYKKNVVDLATDTSVLYQVQAREYDTKEDNTHHIGYIAEELEQVCPSFTWKNPDGTPEGVEWFTLLVFAIEEIKNLKQELSLLTKNT